MKRKKIRITDPNTFHHEFEDGTAIGGSFGEPIVVDISLNQKEFTGLMSFMRGFSDLRHDLALYNFINSISITDWHKRILRKNFKVIPEGIKIELK